MEIRLGRNRITPAAGAEASCQPMRIDSARALASRWTPWLFNASVAIVLRLALPVDISARGERYTYYAMSRAFPLPQCSLFHCFRFLAPLYAALPPLGILDSFITVGFVFQVLAGVMLWHVSHLVTGSRRIAFLTSAWYWATWGPILSLSDPLLITDPAQAFWSLAALRLLLAERYPLALAMLTSGAAVKESVLLVPMVYGVFVLMTKRRPDCGCRGSRHSSSCP
jgi:hypothetical protein